MATTRSNSSILFEYPPDGEVDTARGLITFTTHDQRQLKRPRFLNDTLISFFMQYHLDNCVSQKNRDKIHLFNSFFYAKINSLRSKGDESESYKCVSRWLKGVQIFSKEFLIMPVCENDHWVLVIICYPAEPPRDGRSIQDNDLREPAVLVLNSWNGYHVPSLKKTLNRFLKFQWLAERGSTRHFKVNNGSTNVIRLLSPALPQQKNEFDCGIFIINYFICFLKDPRDFYLRSYRERNMSNLFLNNADICLDRRKMEQIIEQQIELWDKSGSKDRQDMLNASTSANGKTSVDLTENRDNKVIVINLY